jgi:Swt1-like HEPN
VLLIGKELATVSEEKTLKAILAIQKSLDTSPFAEIAQASTRTSEALRHIYENPGMERMMESIQASEVAMRLTLGPAEELRKQHEALMRVSIRPMEELRLAALGPALGLGGMQHATMLDLHSPVMRHIEEAQRAIAGYTDRFSLPGVTEAARLLEQFRIDPMKDIASRFGVQEASLQRAMASMRTPWLDLQKQMRSISGFVELQGIGAALRSAAVFDESLTVALRGGLGGWRDRIIWPKDIFTDLAGRSEFYVGLGFNQALADFPAPAFEQSLDLAELRSEPPTLIDLYGAPVAPSDDEAEEGFARTNAAHDWLLRLETQLRNFIDAVMTRSFGAKWHKQRLPNGLYDEWQERKRKAMQSGGKDWPLIAYADFTDYERVICKGDNWREVFAVFFVRSESVRESFQRLYPIRLDTMHARPITQDDELLLYVETRRLVKVIKKRLN